MSNREIIEWLRKKAETVPMPGARKMYEAAARAMEASDRAKALCADCISRQKLLDKFEPWLDVQDYNDGERNVIKAVLYEIKCMPPATDNNVATTDCISRQAAIDAITDELDKIDHVPQWVYDRLENRIKQLQSAEEESFEWCTDCKEYDQEKHCCHRWTKVIRNTVEEIRGTTAVGEWVKVHGFFTPGGDPVWKCSNCGKGMHVYGVEHGSYGADIADQQWVACPNCGAVMIGERNE